jgi:aldehyde dehydrogenase (NAD+)
MVGWQYSESTESPDIVSIKKKYTNYIGGKFLEPKSKKYINTISPSTEELLSKVPLSNEQDINSAVKSAKEGLEIWSKLTPNQRSRYLFKIARLIQERSREFAVLESLDGGKPIKESRDFDLPQVAANFFYFAGWADKLDLSWATKTLKPYGVVGQIIPWNFPLLMLSWKIAPALATGNTVVLKPAETTPLTALLFAEICEQAGLPPGVVNIVTGDGSTGSLIVNHKDINKIAFTGSTHS